MDLAQIEGYAKDGSAPHQIYLSRLYMMGAGVSRDVNRAMEWLNTAVKQGDAAAFTERAVVRAQGYAGAIDRADAWQDMLEAAERGDVGATRQLGAITHMIGDTDSALGLLQAAAKAGDAPSKILLADLLREAGDPDAAYWYHACKGNALADWRIETHGYSQPPALAAPERNVPSDILDMLDGFDPFDAEPIVPQRRHSNPQIFVKAKAIPSTLCQYVMAAGSALIRESEVVDPDTGKSKIDPYRTGFLSQFVPGVCDFTVAVFDYRIALHSDTAPQQGEPLTMIVYKPGQQYKPHWDFLVDTMDESFGRLGRSGNRERTALVILDEGFTGGATRFTRLDLDIRLQRGDMLVFQNIDENGNRHDDSMHAGLPVEAGMKWLASKWIRERAYAH
ncbi:MAG: 2OG-Fe(II) oxygenase [Pseudomonadota bacterium]